MAIVQWCFGPMSLSWVSVSMCNHLLPASCLLKCWPMRRLLRIELDPCSQADTPPPLVFGSQIRRVLFLIFSLFSHSSISDFSTCFLYLLFLTFSNPSFLFSSPESSIFFLFFLYFFPPLLFGSLHVWAYSQHSLPSV